MCKSLRSFYGVLSFWSLTTPVSFTFIKLKGMAMIFLQKALCSPEKQKLYGLSMNCNTDFKSDAKPADKYFHYTVVSTCDNAAETVVCVFVLLCVASCRSLIRHTLTKAILIHLFLGQLVMFAALYTTPYTPTQTHTSTHHLSSHKHISETDNFLKCISLHSGDM